MQRKSFKLLSIILIMLATMLVLSGCGKSGTRFGNQAPEIKITSFEGWDDSYVTNGYDTNITYSFQQRIYWHAWDKDGNIAGYAFRILDENGDPIATPGYEVIATAADNLIPQNLLDLDPKGGWVVHYVPGEDETLSLSDTNTRRTIWTSQKYAVINFPAADANGNPLVRASKFEVVAVDNRGAITPVIAWRNFKTSSMRPTCTISTTKGNPNGGVVGAGLKLSFTMDDTDPFIAVVPYRYQFQIMKLDLQGNVITPPESLVWVDTKNQIVEPGNVLIIGEFLLNLKSNPPLRYDYDSNGNQISSTRVISRATDLAGIVSIPGEASVIDFKVKSGFSPTTLVYSKKTYAMGDYHYEDWGDDTTPEVLPTQYVQGSQRWATPLFKDFEDKYTAVYSNNLKLWLRWGWFGEYGDVTSSGLVTYVDGAQQPLQHGKKVDVVLDRATGTNYFSEITHFWLRYDNDAYQFPPYKHLEVVDDNGDRWLRVPKNSVIGQSILLTGLPIPDADTPGEHTFEVACEDLQGKVDPQPAVYKFYLHRYIPASNRNGILIIDDDLPNPNQSPQETVTNLYTSMFSGYTGPISFVNQVPPGASIDNYTNPTHADARKRQIALSDLQKYKLVVYHNDSPADNGNFVDIADPLTLYMLHGGNLLVSHTSRLKANLETLSPTGRRGTLLSEMGFGNIPQLSALGSSLSNNPYFYKAVGTTSGFADVDLNTTTSFNSIVNTRKGLGSIAYFPNHNGTVIYKLGCKTVGMDNYSPASEAVYNTYNDQPVGIRRETSSGGKAYTLGFPLAFMDNTDAKALINNIISECGL